jgi:acyl-CoA thioester hydrolase
MIRRYTAHFQVRSFELDGWREVPTRMLAAYMEQAAWEASAALGFTQAKYQELGTAWIVRRLTLARLGPIAYEDVLTVDTFISNIKQVRSNRDYEIRGSDGQPVAAGRGDWVYIDRACGTPTRIAYDITEALWPGGATPLVVPPSPAAPVAPPGISFLMPRRAYRYEADSMGHINNTIYFTWLDEALAAALADAGLPLAPVGEPGLRLCGAWYVVDYLRSALPGDDLTITSRVTGTAPGDVLEWTQEIARAGGEVLVRCVSRQQLTGLAESALTADAVVAALTARA